MEYHTSFGADSSAVRLALSPAIPGSWRELIYPAYSGHPSRQPAGGTLGYLSDIYDTLPVGQTASPPFASFAHHTHLVYETIQPLLSASPIAPVWLALPTSLLTRVDVTSQDLAAAGARQQVRRYYLTYNTNAGASSQPAVASVTLEGSCATPGTAQTAGNNTEENGQLQDPSVSYSCAKRPPTTFTYAPTFTSFSPLSFTATAMPSLSANTKAPILFDLNNDGYPDVLDTQATPPVAWVNALGTIGTSTLTGATRFTQTSLALGGSFGDLSNVSQLVQGQNLAIGSFQADGRVDMLWRSAAGTTGLGVNCGAEVNGVQYYCDVQVPYAFLTASQSSTGTWTLTPSAQAGTLPLQPQYPAFHNNGGTGNITPTARSRRISWAPPRTLWRSLGARRRNPQSISTATGSSIHLV